MLYGKVTIVPLSWRIVTRNLAVPVRVSTLNLRHISSTSPFYYSFGRLFFHEDFLLESKN
jgi:hypothetical protein